MNLFVPVSQFMTPSNGPYLSGQPDFPVFALSLFPCRGECRALMGRC